MEDLNISNSTVGPNFATANATEETHTSLVVSEVKLKITYVAIGTLGMLGNLLVLYVIGRSPNMRTKATNMYIMNQSMADFMGAFFMVMTSLFEDTKRKLSGLSDEIYCRMWLTKWLLWAMFMVSTYSLILTTIERYLAVVFAVWHKISFNRTKVIISIVVVWLVSCGYIACYIVIPTQMKNGYCDLFMNYASEQEKVGSAIFNFVMLYLLPLVILVVCYGHIACVLHRRRILPSGHASGQMSRAMNNAIKTLGAISLGFILCWTTNQIIWLMFIVGHPVDITNVFYHTSVIAIFANCCINPLIYAIKYESFQRNLHRLFPWLPRCRRGRVEPGGMSQGGTRSLGATASTQRSPQQVQTISNGVEKQGQTEPKVEPKA